MDTNEVEVRRAEPNRRGVVFAAVAMSIDLARWLASPERSGAPLSRLSSKNGRPRLDGFPAKEIILAGPRVDFGLTNPAFEFAGAAHAGMLLPCCGTLGNPG